MFLTILFYFRCWAPPADKVLVDVYHHLDKSNVWQHDWKHEQLLQDINDRKILMHWSIRIGCCLPIPSELAVTDQRLGRASAGSVKGWRSGIRADEAEGRIRVKARTVVIRRGHYDSYYWYSVSIYRVTQTYLHHQQLKTG